MPGPCPRRLASLLTLVLAARTAAATTPPGHEQKFVLRGVELTLRVQGSPGAPCAALLSSGDGGYVHLAPEVAALLVERGCYVLGLDSRAYLSSFTARGGPLHPDEVRRDYAALVDALVGGGRARPLLAGVSEGAALSVLAAGDQALRARIGGVLAFGLPDVNELGWRWRDALIYFTKKVPNEPTFRVRDVVADVAPAPLAVLQSSQDEFVPRADTEAIFGQARDPKRLWLIDASNHRFTGARAELSRCLDAALAWMHAPR